MRSQIRNPTSEIRNGFTLIELMVVIAILVVLIGAVITVGRSVVGKGKERETSALLMKLDMATKEFQSKKPLGKMRDFISRYGNFPPDELDGFSGDATVKISGSTGSGHIAPTGASLFVQGAEANAGGIRDKIKYGDIKAAALAIRVFSDEGAAILDQIAPKYRRAADKGPAGNFEYLERSQPANTTLDPGVDEPLDYFVDAWGTPISYFSVRCDGCNPTNVTATNAAAADNPYPAGAPADRLKTSLCLLELNNYVAFFVSYGADGPEQFHKDFVSTGDAQDLIQDYNSPVVGKIDNRFNTDNLYSSEGLKERIAAH